MASIYDGLAGSGEREAAYEKFVWGNLKRNFSGHFMHGMLGMTGFRLINAPTFIPAYLHMLSGSDMVVGLGLALQQLGIAITSIVGTTQIEHRRYVLPLSLFLGSMMRLQILGLVLVGWLFSGPALLAGVLFFLFTLGLFSGPQNVAFQFLLAKMIPISVRGRLQGVRNVSGGLVAAILSYYAGKYLIGENIWGNGYSTTFLAAFILTSLGLVALWIFVREPEPPTLRPRMRVGDRLREFPAMLRADRPFALFMVARTFAVFNRVSAPFYIVYIAQTTTLTGATIGTLTFAFLIASTVANIVWGFLSDKAGFRSTFIAALVLWIGATVMLMFVHGLPYYFVAFFGLGAANSGYFMSAQNMVLEFGHRDDTAMRLAMSNTAESIVAAGGPLLGGAIAATLGYHTVFAVSIVCEAIALFMLVFMVEEPRKKWQARERTRDAALGVNDPPELP